MKGNKNKKPFRIKQIKLGSPDRNRTLNELKENKGINFPGAYLQLTALTDRDRSIIPFVCQHADLVGYSFVHRPGDIMELQEALASEKKRPYIILKIETPDAIMNFPALLLQG
jgi:pyruvate kinase